MTWLYIAVGGAIGAVARYGLGGWVQRLGSPSFPWGTFAVNVSGSFALGLAVRLLEGATPELRGLATVGILGAFTTFSTFSYEAVALLQRGEPARALSYLLGSVGLGMMAVLLGLAAGGWAGAR